MNNKTDRINKCIKLREKAIKLIKEYWKIQTEIMKNVVSMNEEERKETKKLLQKIKENE